MDISHLGELTNHTIVFTQQLATRLWARVARLHFSLNGGEVHQDAPQPGCQLLSKSSILQDVIFILLLQQLLVL
jgi:hypothetical protein